MFLRINDEDYEINKITPLNFNLCTLEWQPIIIETKEKITMPDKLESLVLKNYLKEGQDAEIVFEAGIVLRENLINIPKVSYCSILR